VKYLKTTCAVAFIFLFAVTKGNAGKDEAAYIYSSREEVPRYFSVVTDEPEFNRMWNTTITEILSRQLENGQLIESSTESGLYPHSFPRSVTTALLIKSGRLAEARKHLDFLWEHQKGDGSFWNFYNRKGKGEGLVEEDGGCYVVGHTYLYYLYSGDRDYLNKRWRKIAKAMDFIENLFDKNLGLVYSTAGYSEGNIKGGHNIYHQAISVFGFRSASGIASALGKDSEASSYRKYVKRIKKGIYDNLFNEEEGRFSFQRRKEGGFFDPPYPAFLVLAYYDVFDPREEAFEGSFKYLVEGPRYGEYSEEIFGLEPFDHDHSTGRGFWIGQNGHGWVIPYLLKAGRMDEANRWMKGLIAATDNRTFLVPEHINFGPWDPDGGSWDGKHYGVLPDPTAWVDPGNLYALSTAMHLVFNLVETDPGDEKQKIYFRVPPTFNMVGVSNLRIQAGYLDASYFRKGGEVEISVSGSGEGKLVVVGFARNVQVERDGTPWNNWLSDAAGDIIITTDLNDHTFTITSKE